jgi:hypothetical protein
MTDVTIITTLQHNVGDDFVREGIIYLLGHVLGPMKLRMIHKHLPITTRGECAWLHDLGVDRWMDRRRPGSALRVTSRLDSVLPLVPWTDKVLRGDVLVQSGAPVYWANTDADCAQTEWWTPLIERRWTRRAAGRPFLNLAGGTCQHYHSDASEFASRAETLAYIRRYYDLCKLTTVRDRLSTEVLRHAGRQAELLPCTSIFAVDRLGISPLPGEYVALNYMPGGGHYEFGQPIDGKLWESRFVSFVKKYSAKTRCLLVCHDQKELSAARRLLPDVPTFWAPHHEDYLRCYSKARFGIVNRVHAAFALGSMGKPSVVIGSDSRALMAEMIGLTSVFVNDATEEWLAASADRLEKEAGSYAQDMAARKEAVKARYLKLLTGVLGQH